MGLIVMQQTVQVEGEYFLANRQYEHTGTSFAVVRAEGVDRKDVGRLIRHYIVNRNGVSFDVPSCVCVEYDTVIPEAEQNKQQHYFDSITDQTKDPIQRLEAVTGIRIDNRAGADIDLRAYNALVAANPGIVSNNEGLLPQE